jgi:hypothetical protein
MIVYVIASITCGFMYYNYKNKYTLVSNIPCVNLSDKYKIYKKNILNKNNTNKISWDNQITPVNYEINKTQFFKKLEKTLEDIRNKNHLCFWILENNIYKIKNYNVVAFNLKSIYNYELNSIEKKDFLENLALYCHNNKIIFVIISEISPKLFKQHEPKYFNKNNYYSPFNYKNKMFGNIQKLELNKFAQKPANISINRIILDIMNRYCCNKDKIIYIDNQSLINMNNFNPFIKENN